MAWKWLSNPLLQISLVLVGIILLKSVIYTDADPNVSSSEKLTQDLFWVYLIGLHVYPVLIYVIYESNQREYCEKKMSDDKVKMPAFKWQDIVFIGIGYVLLYLVFPFVLLSLVPPPRKNEITSLVETGHVIRLTIGGMTTTHTLRILEILMTGKDYYDKYGINSSLRALIPTRSTSTTKKMVNCKKKKKKKCNIILNTFFFALYDNIIRNAVYYFIKPIKKKKIGLWLSLKFLALTAVEVCILRCGALLIEHFEKHHFAGNVNWIEEKLPLLVKLELECLYTCVHLQYLINRLCGIYQLLFFHALEVELSMNWSYLSLSPRDFWTRQTRHQKRGLVACFVKPIKKAKKFNTIINKNFDCSKFFFEWIAIVMVFIVNCLLHTFVSVITNGEWQLQEWIMIFTVLFTSTYLQTMTEKWLDRNKKDHLKASWWYKAFWEAFAGFILILSLFLNFRKKKERYLFIIDLCHISVYLTNYEIIEKKIFNSGVHIFFYFDFLQTEL
ncbi:hypothetical protein RFI_14067 [Reticulomyxa filosa]|uniref:Uncharacterized protein n=1 Tax=Reticulomyxa filosa TaxID=46433 RepID=X6N9Z7_RETFI|nr:hypothetical protein RFI_14067 [Reticulomyxa filosa]|eukprot:ETO23120.1 hypothetical protein RFI_14067 [Reticulomyxa filosa]